MVEIVLISVAVVAVLLFTMNLRSARALHEPGGLLDGSPRWLEGHIVSVETRQKYLGMTSAKIAVELAGKSHELVGLIPDSHETQLTAGTSVSGHVEYDLLDTLRTHLWDGETETVLRACSEALGGEIDSNDALYWFTVDLTEYEHLWVSLSGDGWLNIEVPARTELDDSQFLDFRSTWSAETEGELYMLGDKLAVEGVDDSEPFIASLSASSIERMESFTEATEGWITVSSEGFEFECGLPFAEPALIIALVHEFQDLVANLSGDTSQQSDGHW